MHMEEQAVKPLAHRLLQARQFPMQEVCDLPASAFPKAGIYGWFFAKDAFDQIPYDGCTVSAGRYLLYLGIGPASPRSANTLYKRLVGNHCRGRARSSTLRRSIGCLKLLELSLVPRAMKGERLGFTPESEGRLSQWMRGYAHAAWIEQEEPWLSERALIAYFRPPLNIEHNTEHPFSAKLSIIRAAALPQPA